MTLFIFVLRQNQWTFHLWTVSIKFLSTWNLISATTAQFFVTIWIKNFSLMWYVWFKASGSLFFSPQRVFKKTLCFFTYWTTFGVHFCLFIIWQIIASYKLSLQMFLIIKVLNVFVLDVKRNWFNNLKKFIMVNGFYLQKKNFRESKVILNLPFFVLDFVIIWISVSSLKYLLVLAEPNIIFLLIV